MINIVVTWFIMGFIGWLMVTGWLIEDEPDNAMYVKGLVVLAVPIIGAAITVLLVGSL